jgi:hypothetical protein
MAQEDLNFKLEGALAQMQGARAVINGVEARLLIF